jgi:iron complex outermembrane receptor protein
LLSNHLKKSQTTLDTVKISATTLNEEEEENLPYNTSYTRKNASTATKTDTPIMETPVSIQVIPKSVMQSQKARA